ncbi:MAG: biopolymer transporter ExbD [Chitinivibrionales bacterium]|nr:biopolymer transporter ExbD [Chitinivibrionales bacterium]
MRIKRNRRRRKVIADLNITNLVDVVLTLLIVFMITAPMMTQGVQVDLPKADAQNVEARESIQISINAKNEIFINEERIALIDFAKRFNDLFAGRSHVPVYINADRKVPYGLVVRVIADVQNAGVVKLGFLTVPLDEKG